MLVRGKRLREVVGALDVSTRMVHAQRNHRRPNRGLLALGLAAALLTALLGCGDGELDFVLPSDAVFSVTNPAGMPVAGATVFLVPASDIDTGDVTGNDVLSGAAETRDEPLEDAVRLRGASYPRGVTDAGGRVLIADVPFGTYFWFVLPAAGDTEHLPGGEGCRLARQSTTFLGTTTSIRLTSQPSAAAAFVGSTTCLACHSAHGGFRQHAHRLAFTVPGQLSALQDATRYPNIQGGWATFLPAAVHTGGTPVYFSDFDGGRETDKFKTSLSDPRPAETLFVIAWLWRDTADNRFKITLENVINAIDPPRTLVVELTYGGPLHMQRSLVSVPGRNGRYPLLQWQSEGDETKFDRTRKVFRDYRLDSFWSAGTQTFTDPPVDTAFEGNCTGCHSNGFERFRDPGTNEWLSRAVSDVGGAFDIDGDGPADEINLGCETCHGAGSEHVAWAQANPVSSAARFIVSNAYLSPSRDMQVCGRCHDRVVGNGPHPTGEPLDPQGRRARPGISRMQFLANHVTRKGPDAADYWNDDLHSRNHYQQYADMLKSKKHRNDRILTTCTDCHESHGNGPFVRHLRADPSDANSALCQQCHLTDHFQHMFDETGTTHAGDATTCVRCHQTWASRAGAGRYGIIITGATGTALDLQRTYFQNDRRSHLFLGVPGRLHPDVAGVLPAFAMPIPFTNECGAGCHSVVNLQNLKPTNGVEIDVSRRPLPDLGRGASGDDR